MNEHDPIGEATLGEVIVTGPHDWSDTDAMTPREHIITLRLAILRAQRARRRTIITRPWAA